MLTPFLASPLPGWMGEGVKC